MVRVGIVGLGFMGRMHYRCWKASPNAAVTAICEANRKVLESAAEAPNGNVGGAADHIEALSQRYTGGPYRNYGGRSGGRVLVRIAVDRIVQKPW